MFDFDMKRAESRFLPRKRPKMPAPAAPTVLLPATPP
jgi:hypothetical protein